MKQEKGRTFNNISKGVKSTRSKLKQTAISTPIKNAPLTAKVNSTWNNVLNKNKVLKYGRWWLYINQPEKFIFTFYYLCGLKGLYNWQEIGSK